MNGAQIEAGLDRVTVSAPAIREMTGLVLQEIAQGLEPRIVRSIVERIEQVLPSACVPLSTPVCPRLPGFAATSVPWCTLLAECPWQRRRACHVGCVVSQASLTWIMLWLCRSLGRYSQQGATQCFRGTLQLMSRLMATGRWRCCMCWTACSRNASSGRRATGAGLNVCACATLATPPLAWRPMHESVMSAAPCLVSWKPLVLLCIWHCID